MKYSVKDLREGGLEARWTKNSRGAPIIVARCPMANSKHQREKWWMVDNGMFEAMKQKGIIEAFSCHTLLGDIFSVPV